MADEKLQAILDQLDPKPKLVSKPHPIRKATPMEALLSKTFPPANYLIGSGLLSPGAMMFIGGPPKSYKSFILNTILVSLVTGKSLFGATRKLSGGRHKPQDAFPVPKPQRVLLLEQEVGEEDLQARFLPVLKALNSAEQKLFGENMYVHSCDYDMLLDKHAGCKYISDIIKDVKPTILAIDPLIEFHTSNENDTQNMALILHHLTILRQDHNLSTIINHHTSKPSSDSPRRGPDLLRGSSVLFGKGDTFLMLNKTDREGIIKIDFTLRRAKPLSGIYVRLNTETLLFDFDHWSKSHTPTANEAAILEQLEEGD